MFDGGDKTFMQLQACLDGVMKGTIYAGHLPSSEGKLLQLLQSDNGDMEKYVFVSILVSLVNSCAAPPPKPGSSSVTVQLQQCS